MRTIIQKQPPEMFYKVFLEILQNSPENTCARVSFLIKLQASGLIKKETLAQVFSCFAKFCKISKNTSFPEQLRTTASNYSLELCSYPLGFPIFSSICYRILESIEAILAQCSNSIPPPEISGTIEFKGTLFIHLYLSMIV